MTKAKYNQDPYANREAENYDNPIPSREFILDVINEQDSPQNLQQIIQLFEIEDAQQQEGIRRRLKAMERDGQLIWIKGFYHLVDSFALVEGLVSAHPDGYGFVLAEDGGEDVFIGQREMHQVFHEDRVAVRVTKVDKRGRREGVVVKIIDHNTSKITGLFTNVNDQSVVMADHKKVNHDIVVADEYAYGAKEGQVVVVEITQYPTRFKPAQGRIVQILGSHIEPGQEIDVSMRIHDIPHEWPIMVEAEIEDLEPYVKDKDKKKRTDYRNVPLVTIDGEDARDFDDAVYCQRIKNGWRLTVAIADVSFYVQPETGLDAEAMRRGTSVYFPGRVIPMLPEILSNGLCSLNPQEDRLCLACEIDFSDTGEIQSYQFKEAVMCSAARLTYSQVADMIIEGDAELCAQYAEILPHLHELYQLYQNLLARRSERGAIDFETTETKVVFGDNKKIDKIVPVYRNDAHRIIEECMLAANVCAADYLLKNEVPALYRNHEGPTEEKLTNLREMLSLLGLHLEGADEPSAKDYANLLIQIKERPDAEMLQTLMLRSLSQAMYEANNKGHFGLAYEAYAHFTSPIRRYPDLLVHRAIKFTLNNKKPKRLQPVEARMHELGEHCSIVERRADEATRDAMDWLKCEYMLDKVGMVFNGRITTVTGFGLFVELDNIHVEGLIHVTSLRNDYYIYDKSQQQLRGERNGTIYKLADSIKIKVAGVSLDERKIDFLIYDERKEKKRPPNRNQSSGQQRGANKKSTANTTQSEQKKVEPNKTKQKKKASRRRARKSSFSRRV